MKRTWSNLLFSFEGRITRSEYWTGICAVIVGVMLTCIMAAAIIAGFDAISLKPVGGLIGILMSVGECLGGIWAYYALGIKRLHDQGLSGWWMLLQVVPYLGPLALLIILGFVPGNAWENEFGPNPKDPASMNNAGWSVQTRHS